jgi:hypothetical protein
MKDQMEKLGVLTLVLWNGLFDQFRLLLGSSDWKRVLWTTNFDSILLSWIAEWGFQSLFIHHYWERFWNSLAFFPHQNTLAYADCLLGLQPLYAAGKTAGGKNTTSA